MQPIFYKRVSKNPLSFLLLCYVLLVILVYKGGYISSEYIENAIETHSYLKFEPDNLVVVVLVFENFVSNLRLLLN